MAQTVKLKRSSVAGNVPGSGQMTPGELAMNTADGKLFLRDDSDVRPIVTVDAEVTGSLNLIGNITASGEISASTYTGFGTDLQIASASNIDNLYITEFRETGSNFNQSEGQPEIGSVLVLDISGSGDGNESVLRRMDFQAFNKAFYASASYAKLLEISESIASDVAVGAYVNGIFYPNGLAYDLNQDGVVGAPDVLQLLTAYGNTLADPDAQGSPTINKQQLSTLNAIHEGNGDTQVISGSLYLTTSSISGSYLDLLENGTLFIESHFTSSGKILGNGLTINGNTTLNSNLIDLGVDDGDRININSYITTRLDVQNNITASGNISSSGELIGIINGGSF
jgi:hypothetical protein